jgi:hypothetical protein
MGLNYVAFLRLVDSGSEWLHRSICFALVPQLVAIFLIISHINWMSAVVMHARLSSDRCVFEEYNMQGWTGTGAALHVSPADAASCVIHEIEHISMKKPTPQPAHA